MLAASLLGIFIIPALYVVFQWLRERGHKLAGLKEYGTSVPPPAREAAETPDEYGEPQRTPASVGQD